MFKSLQIFVIALTFISVITSCKSASEDLEKLKVEKRETTSLSDAQQSLELAHQVSEFYQYENVSFDIVVQYQGRKPFRGIISTLVDSRAIRLDYTNGKKLLHRDGKLFTSDVPNTSDQDLFDIFSWQYFFMSPFKLSEKGVKWHKNNFSTGINSEYNSAKITFEEGTGLNSKGWHIIQQNKENQLIDRVVYIEYTDIGNSPNQDIIRSISYYDYQEIQGIPFAHRWVFNEYSLEEGIGKEIGNATIGNIRFNIETKQFDPDSDILFVEY